MNISISCKHRPIRKIGSKLYPDYDDGLYQRMYIEVKEGILEHLIILNLRIITCHPQIIVFANIQKNNAKKIIVFVATTNVSNH
jgi:hypothetical protein